MNNREKLYLDRMAQLSCSLCGAHGVEIHHIREGRGLAQRSSHYLTIPLCPSCHRDNHNGIHGDRAMLKIHKTTELDLLAATIEKMLYVA